MRNEMRTERNRKYLVLWSVQQTKGVKGQVSRCTITAGATAVKANER